MHQATSEMVPGRLPGTSRSVVICLVCACALTVASLANVWIIRCGAAVVGMCCLALGTLPAGTPEQSRTVAGAPNRKRTKPRSSVRPSTGAAGLVDEMLQDGRYTLLLRQQIFDGLSEQNRESALAALNDGMVRTTGGKVQLYSLHGHSAESEPRIVELAPFYIDRFPVTNCEYERFILAGGYEQASMWSPRVLGRLAEFTDRTGHPGPRFWADGQFPEGEDLRPVVGISWYEAMAYARWVGKRLPSDPEWVKAAATPVELSDGRVRQRIYPWGDTMDRTVANVWGSGTVDVDEFPAGASPHGVHQLVGNVWEWLFDDFGVWEEEEDRLESSVAMKSIRGGAFDTYFDNHATTRFQSADSILARKHNIGFRCAIAAQDLTTVVAH